MFFDRRCPGCGRIGSSLCVSCRSLLRAPAAPVLPVPVHPVAGVDSVTAAYRYDERIARLIVAGKNGARCDLLRIMGRSLGATLRLGAGHTGPVEAVTWVPASPSRRRRRGYDQGRVLARPVGRAVGAPTRKLLVRTSGREQANRSRQGRLIGPAISALRPAPASVLLVDDVATTGTSLAVAAAALRHAGARRVAVGVVAVVEEPMGFTG